MWKKNFKAQVIGLIIGVIITIVLFYLDYKNVLSALQIINNYDAITGLLSGIIVVIFAVFLEYLFVYKDETKDITVKEEYMLIREEWYGRSERDDRLVLLIKVLLGPTFLIIGSFMIYINICEYLSVDISYIWMLLIIGLHISFAISCYGYMGNKLTDRPYTQLCDLEKVTGKCEFIQQKTKNKKKYYIAFYSYSIGLVKYIHQEKVNYTAKNMPALHSTKEIYFSRLKTVGITKTEFNRNKRKFFFGGLMFLGVAMIAALYEMV